MPIERKLAAIMFTDIAGYTESMSKSESNTLNLLEKKRSILKPLLKKYKGTFVKEIGDGTLSYFESAVNAATCAVKLQEMTYDDKEMNIRVGIHIGDIVFKDGDVFGGGVNVASRLESIAPEGGVCVSKSVYDELSNQDDFDGIELGLQSLKGVGRLIEVFGLKGDKLNEPKPSEYQDNKVDKHSDDEIPSIAIIPFENKGADEDVFYAYGISADLISDCSGAGLIRVAGLKDIENLDYKNLQYDELAKKLSVRYVSHGALWKMGEMFQLSIELYDSKDKKVIWSDRWQEDWEMLTSIKNTLSDGILKYFNKSDKNENTLATINTEAYKYYLEGKYNYNNWKDNNDIQTSIDLFNKSIEIDNNCIESYRMLGWIYKRKHDFDIAHKYFKKYNLLAIDNNLSEHCGWSYMFLGDMSEVNHDAKQAETLYQKALDIFTKHDIIKGISGVNYNLGITYEGYYDYETAMTYFKKSEKIEHSLKTKNSQIYSVMSGNYLDTGDIVNAKIYIDKALSICNENKNTDQYIIVLLYLIRYYEFIKDYDKVISYSEEIIKLAQIQGWKPYIGHYVSKNLSKKMLNVNFDNKELLNILNKKKVEDLDYEITYKLYLLLIDSKYLDYSYNTLDRQANKLSSSLKSKFLSYPIPKEIVEEWEKVQ